MGNSPLGNFCPLGQGGEGVPIWQHLEISLIDPFERMSDWHLIDIDQGQC